MSQHLSTNKPTKMDTLREQIGKLIQITKDLEKNYPPKKFTLDGRLVGDIGETIAEKNYKIKLHEKVVKDYDGIIENTDKRVQIKSTMKNFIGYPKTHNPDYFLAIKILENGDFIEIYNGTTKPIEEYIIQAGRKAPKNFNFINITLKTLERLNENVKNSEKIPRRN